MARATSPKTTRPGSRSVPGDAGVVPKIGFQATLLRPKTAAKPVSWTFLILPQEASAQLPSRSMVSVEGVFNGSVFQATLEPDGRGSHWLKVDQDLRERAGAEPGDVVTLEIAPVTVEPEPPVPDDLHQALASAPPEAFQVWTDITPLARRDWIQWIESAKREETRRKRIETGCDMLAQGKRRPCCFDRSGIYSKGLTCPVAEEIVSDKAE